MPRPPSRAPTRFSSSGILSILLKVFILAALWRFSIAHVTDFPDVRLFRLAAYILPVTYLAFTLAHLLFHVFGGAFLLAADTSSYAAIPALCALVFISRTHPTFSWIAILFFLILSIIKIFFLFRHLVRVLRRPGKQSVRDGLLALFIFCLLLPFGGITFGFSELRGDEPYYMLLAHSLFYDRDIDLENNYIARDSLTFMDKPLVPQLWDTYSNGKLLSRHSAALPLLLIPLGIPFHRLGALATMHLLAIISALLLFKTLMKLTHSVRGSLITTVLFSASLPLLAYSHRIYAEIPGALAALAVFYLALSPGTKPMKTFTLAAVISLFAAWMKTRFAVLMLPMILFSAFSNRFSRRALLMLTSAIILIVLIVGGVNYAVFGSLLGHHDLSEILGTTPIKLLRGILAQFWDIQYGIFSMNPVLLVAVSGIIPMLRALSRRKTLLWLAAWIPYFLLVAGYAEGIGGDCPRGRFAVAWVVFLAVPMAFALAKRAPIMPRALLRITFPATLLIVVLSWISPDRLMDRAGFSDNLWEALSIALHRDFLGILPSLDRPYPHSLLYPAALLLATFTLLPVLGARRRFTRTPKTPATASLCLLGVALIMPGISAWCAPAWMEAEDRTFFHENASLFWEEECSWESHYKGPWRYRVGIRLEPDGYLARTIPLRKRGNGLEVIARAILDDGQPPRLFCKWNNAVAGINRIHSTEFDSYFFPLPATASQKNGKLMLYNYAGKSRIVIDKIRRIASAPETSAATSDTVLPITCGNFTLRDVTFFRRNILQGECLPMRFHLEVAGFPPPMRLLLRWTHNDQVWEQPVVWEGQNLVPLASCPPPELGTGRFHLTLTPENPKIVPRGENLFTIGDRPWIGDVTITQKLQPAREKDIALLKHLAPPRAVIVPRAVHLSDHHAVTIDLDRRKRVSAVFILSNLTHVLYGIPFGATVGTIRINSQNNSTSLPLVIGEETGEEMFELTGKTLRLSHKEAPVVRRENKTVEWPPLLRGITYPALTYSCRLALPEPIIPESITITANLPRGVLNVYALALETVE